MSYYATAKIKEIDGNSDSEKILEFLNSEDNAEMDGRYHLVYGHTEGVPDDMDKWKTLHEDLEAWGQKYPNKTFIFEWVDEYGNHNLKKVKGGEVVEKPVKVTYTYPNFE